MRNLPLFLLMLLNGFSCNDQNKPAKFDLASVEKLIDQANHSYGKRFTSNDSFFYIERYTTDAEVFPAQNPIVTGRANIQKYFYNNGENEPIAIELGIRAVYGNPDLVVEEGLYNFPDGKGGSIDKGKYLALWKVEAGKWKIFREIWNSDLPPSSNQ